MGRPVLYLLDYADLGGGETSFLAFVEEWLRAVPQTPPVVVLPQAGPVGRELQKLGVETHPIDFPRRLRRGPIPWFSLPAALRIDRLVGQLNPAIIHANNFFGMLYAGLAARRRGLPLVWTCHGWYEVDRPVKRWIARRCATHIACVSEAVRQEAARFLNRPGFTSTDYLGIRPFMPDLDTNVQIPNLDPTRARNRNRNRKDVPDHSEFDKSSQEALRQAIRQEMGIPEGQPLIAVIGRFQPIKGHQYLFDALPAIRRRVPDLKVWLIGDALFGSREEEDHKRALEDRVRAEGLAGCVEFLGFRADARRLIRALDALAVSSERESFSMVAVEGLEAGIPVVAPDGWGPKEIVEAPRTGLLFQPAHPASLAEKVIQALTREADGAAFDPTAGPQRVTELFTVEAHVRRTLALYQSLTGETTIRGPM